MEVKFRGAMDSYHDILRACESLELNHPGLRISQHQRLLLIEKGTVEGLLTVLEGWPVKVVVVSQTKGDKLWNRVTELRGARPGGELTLIRAASIIAVAYIPPAILAELESGKKGIGEILNSHKIETRREITEVGYEPNSFSIYRTYLVHVGGVAWFRIRESFDRSLYARDTV